MSKAEKAAKYQSLLAAASSGSVRLAASKAKGRHVKATANLPPGTSVVVETASAFVLLKHAMDELCLYCCKELESDTSITGGKINLLGGGGAAAAGANNSKIKCPHCIKQTFYCSQTCLTLDSERHGLECKVVRDLPGITAAAKVDYSLMRLVLAVLVQRHLETINHESSGGSNSTTVSVEGAVRLNTSTDLVFDLLSHRKTCDPKWLACVETCAEDFVLHLPQELSISVSDVVSLACRINSNSHGIVDPTGNTNGEVGVGMFPLVAMLNHSCEPNCSFVSSTHGKMIVRTLCPIQEGQELCVSYVDLCTPRDERRGKLLETKHFWCQCSRCEPTTSSTATTTQMEAMHPDAHLDALLCTTCNSPDAFYNSLQDFQCTLNPSHQITKSQHTERTHEAESAHNNAHDLFKARHNDSAITAFLKFISEYKAILHRNHFLFLNTYATMTSAFLRLRKFASVVRYGRLAIELMRRNVPPNWPELADFWFRQAEMLEILGRAVENDVIDVEEAKQAFDGDDLLQEGVAKELLVRAILNKALTAFETCLEMRRIAYGEDHCRTVEVSSEVVRLRVDLGVMWSELLGVGVTATSKEISKAYRLKALKVHPDKVGPDNKEAADAFLLLTQAVDCLTDASKRAVYEEAHKAKLAKLERVEKLDAKRKQAREDLEAREAGGFKKARTEEMNEAEIKRLREEGLRRLAEMTRQDEEERAGKLAKMQNADGDLDHALSIKWKPKKISIDENQIEALYATFGEIETFRVLKKGRALLLYKKAEDAGKIYRKRESFKDYEISWTVARTEEGVEAAQAEPIISAVTPVANATSGFSFNIAAGPAASSSGPGSSYESDVLRRMRERAEAERKAQK